MSDNRSLISSFLKQRCTDVNVLQSLIIGLVILLSGCAHEKLSEPNNEADNQSQVKKERSDQSKIQVLNIGTFHMGLTSDAHKTTFNEHDKKNIEEVHRIAIKLAEFKPTVILVEMDPKWNDMLNIDYTEYVSNPEVFFEQPSEIELLAYEVGRLSGTDRIYGIDHQMSYNYRIDEEIENTVDSMWSNKFDLNPLRYYPSIDVDDDSLNLLEKLKIRNHDQYLDFMIAVNAEMLSHAASSDTTFEGSDEATLFYQRNLRMYTNMNRIKLSQNDRVFVLMGAAHTAYFSDFLSRSPKYESVNTFDYLK